MTGKKDPGCTGWQRGELAVTALIPPALALLGPLAVVAGRLAWLVPAALLPAGLAVRRCWAELRDKRGLFGGLRGAFGPRFGPFLALLYLLWGLILLSVAAQRYTLRLSTALGEEGRRLYLLAGLALALWLGQRDKPLLARGVKLFLLSALTALGLALVPALPGVDWKNLWPVERSEVGGFLPAAALALSLSGWGAFALCPPQQGTDEGPGRSWTAAACGLFALLLLAVVGTFGPALTARMDDPFFYLLEGVRVPGAFRRGEAALTALLALADVALLALLVRGCAALWEGLAPGLRGGGIWLPAGLAFLAAGRLDREPVTGNLLFWGGLFFGVLVPALAFLRRKRGADPEGPATSCVEKSP